MEQSPALGAVPLTVHAAAARAFADGPEQCRQYVDRRLWLGTSVVPPHETGGRDPGHPGAEEIFYVVQGHVRVFDDEQYHELNAGDALLIPPSVPHTITNLGDDEAVIVWAGVHLE